MRSLVASAILCVLALPLVVATVGCSDDGDSTPPPTSDGGGNDGGSSSTEGGATQDAAATDSATTGDAGKKPFGEKCENDGECESGTCFVGTKQSYCSIKCTVASQATDCPKPPTTGECNNQGYCKK
jgi:hypothetical protein